MTNEIVFKEICRRLDIDNDGCLSKEELKKAFSCLGACVLMFRAVLALHHADKNGDGFIGIHDDDLEALAQYVARLGYKIQL
ncbi:Calcium-binding EF-hand [Corchorus olitorius]|uniref:Calcium-binding EF-hand n=1 Tax=Corchorus olitorius TaxID=93759 RepID=A0A1R3KER2_9ROSI|nr:Calcium-binding EF-hand [Corchorus olitorius]